MNKIILMAFALSTPLLYACQQKPAEVSLSAPTKSAAATHYLKPGAPVSIASENIMLIPANKLTSIEVMLAAELDEGTMDVSIAAGEGLQLNGTPETYHFTANLDGKYAVNIALFGSEPGRHYVNLQAAINKNSVISSRALTLIVQVGDAMPIEELPSKTLNKISTDNIILLPAQERITNQ